MQHTTAGTAARQVSAFAKNSMNLELGLRTALFAVAVLLEVACMTYNSPPVSRHPLPESPGTPAAREAAQMFTDIANTCHLDWEQWSADVTVRGVAGRSRVNRRLKVAFKPPALRIESLPLNGEDSFILAVNERHATFLFGNSRYAVSAADSRPLIERVLGVPLDSTRFWLLVRGCYLIENFDGLPSTYDPQTMSMPGGRNGRTFFRRDPAGAWRMFSLLYPGKGLEAAWRLDYFDMHEGLPGRLIVTGIETRPLQLDIQLSNALIASLPEDLFDLDIPSSAQRVDVDSEQLQRWLR